MNYSKWHENENSQRSGYQIQQVSASDKWRYEEHFHRGFCEIVYVLSGSLEQTVNGQKIIQNCGDLILLRADDIHSLTGHSFSYANIMFQENWLLRLEQYTQRRGQAQQLLQAENAPRTQIPREQQSAWRGMIDELIGCSRYESGRLVFSNFLALVVNRYLTPNTTEALPEGMPDWLYQTVLWLHRQHNAPPALSKLVQKSCRSQEHLTRAFTQYLQVSPARYIANMRIDQAAVLLSSTNYSVQEICAICGFANESYFYRLFRKQKKNTPLAFRRRFGPRSIQR